MVVSALVMAATASAQLSPSDAPLPGSAFQGADGDQDDAGERLDWQAFEAAGRVEHSPDANDDDSLFTGGSKETEPSSWGLTTEADGVNPAKDNIRDAWSAVDQPAADTFLYLGFARESANGDTFVTFELNHDDRLWATAARPFPAGGRATSRSPTRPTAATSTWSFAAGRPRSPTPTRAAQGPAVSTMSRTCRRTWHRVPSTTRRSRAGCRAPTTAPCRPSASARRR